jgi:hypothetical protein
VCLAARAGTQRRKIVKIAKTLSAKVIAANRRNAAKSTGPKTISGKKNVSRNGVRHGVFARELYVAAEERYEFETLRRNLTSEFIPKTALQKLLLEEIICCAWRCKLATRFEMRQFRSLMGDMTLQEDKTAASRDETVVRGWYAANRQSLQSGQRFLAVLRDAVQQNGRVPDSLKEEVIACFGHQFYDLLSDYIPVNIDFLLFTKQMIGHANTYNIPLPELNDKGEQVMVDIRERLHMAIKLIEQESRHLQDLEQSYEQRNATSRAGPPDFAPRFFTSATRDLHRAIDAFLHLKAHRL